MATSTLPVSVSTMTVSTSSVNNTLKLYSNAAVLECSSNISTSTKYLHQVLQITTSSVSKDSFRILILGTFINQHIGLQCLALCYCIVEYCSVCPV